MADVKWIKLATNIFDNRKIRMIGSMPDGDAIIVTWLKLLCLAGNINDTGMVYFTKEIPYTDQMLATQFNMPLTTVQLALKTFEQFGMIEVIDNVLHISNWEKYQNTDRLADIREYNRIAKQKSRAKQKLLQDVNDKSMTSQSCHETDIDKEEDKDKKKNKKDNDPFLVYQSSDPELFQALKDYESMRKQMKKPMTNRSKGMLLSKLGGFPDSEWIPMLNEAINRNWLSVYPLKEQQGSKPINQQFYHKPSKADELNDAYSMMSSWAEEGDV